MTDKAHRSHERAVSRHSSPVSTFVPRTLPQEYNDRHALGIRTALDWLCMMQNAARFVFGGFAGRGDHTIDFNAEFASERWKRPVGISPIVCCLYVVSHANLDTPRRTRETTAPSRPPPNPVD